MILDGLLTECSKTLESGSLQKNKSNNKHYLSNLLAIVLLSISRLKIRWAIDAPYILALTKPQFASRTFGLELFHKIRTMEICNAADSLCQGDLWKSTYQVTMPRQNNRQNFEAFLLSSRCNAPRNLRFPPITRSSM
jgi:hypothetical protein